MPLHVAYESVRRAATRLLTSTELHDTSDMVAFMREVADHRPDLDAFHVVNVGFLSDRLQFWRTHLRGIEPFYAIKTNHDPVLVAVLAELGTSFDCASINEVQQLRSLGIDPARIIFANPRKSPHTVTKLKEAGVPLLVFDSQEELQKLMCHYPDAQLVLRITAEDRFSVTPLSTKFGASLPKALALLDFGIKHGAQIIGVSFHVGTNCTYVPSYVQAIRDAAALFYHAALKGVNLTLLDLGGGWPGTDDSAFIEIAREVMGLLPALFSQNVRIIAEPGTFFAAQSTWSAVRIIGHSWQSSTQSLYLGNGIYGLFSCGYYHRYKPTALAPWGWEFRPLTLGIDGPVIPSTLWGPTCDATDKIVEDYPLPAMKTGDWLYTPNMGAYTYSLVNNFNQITSSMPLYAILTASS